MRENNARSNTFNVQFTELELMAIENILSCPEFSEKLVDLKFTHSKEIADRIQNMLQDRIFGILHGE